MQLSHTFLLFIVGVALASSSTARRSRVRRQNMKVRINATGDTIVMKFVRPNADTKLEGYILGYGSSMFSKQFIQLPENGLPYETEIDAEPKYLIAVQPVPVNNVKKQCTGKVNLEKPLHLVIGSVTPTSVLLSWGTFLKMPYEGDIMNDCLEDGHYTVRYRERNRKWTQQTCPSSDMVIDNLKPNTAYEFGVRPNNEERSGVWSKPVIHNTDMEKAMQKPFRPRTPLTPVKTDNMPLSFFPPRHAVHNRSQGRTLFRTPMAPRTTFGRADQIKSASSLSVDITRAAPTIPCASPTVPRASPTVPRASSTVPLASSTIPRASPTIPRASPTIPRASPTIPRASPTVSRASSTVPLASPTLPLPSPTLPHASPQLLPSPTLPLASPTAPAHNPHRNTRPQQARPQEARPKPEPQAQPQQARPQQARPQQARPQPEPQAQPQQVRPQKARPQPETQAQPQQARPQQVQPQAKPQAQPQAHPQAQPQAQPQQVRPQQVRSQQARPQSETQAQPQAQPQQARPQQARPQPEPQAQPQQPAKVTQNLQTPTAPSQYQVGQPLPRPALATERANSNTRGTSFRRPLTPTDPRSPIGSAIATAARNMTLPRGRVALYSTPNGIRPLSLPRNKNITSPLTSVTSEADGEHHKGLAIPKPAVWSGNRLGSPAVLRPSPPVNKRPNLVGKTGNKDKPIDLKQGDKESILKSFPLVTTKPSKQKTTTIAPALNATRNEPGDNSSVFSSLPASEVDALGKKRFVAPHVLYKTDKKPDEPCSITHSLSFFPEEEGVEQNVTAPPRLSPSNVTVVTVEGCPSFIILDWEKTDNDTTEYEVISRTQGPNGEEVSILTTNQTHTAVENLKPESSYEFKVKPKNELGEGPASEAVSFNTESADPRVSENVSGKAAIWTQFPFKADSYSECNGKQYVKRTWYRKFVGIQLCNSLRYKIYMSDSLNGKFYNIGDQTGHGEDHCQFVDSFLDGRTGSQLLADQLPSRSGFYRAMRQEPVNFGQIGGNSHATYVGWYECGTPIPGKW
ncbi:target of Nesh-SH3-like isoform X2 [Oncorhynchus clarkii lewisi]|uniref:target of Nesh-SH3-like isoform X2 n=1 Tax=Oncorhynchus clarkii lewisi TaxID=490388 RepID=UPI0039B8B326